MDFGTIFNAFASFLGKKLDHVGVEIKGAEVITIKGEKGDPGAVFDELTPAQKDEIRGERGEQGPPGPAGRDGADGRDGQDGRDGADGADGRDGIDGQDGRDGSPDTGEQIIEKVNKDKSSAKIRKEKVEGLSEIEDLAKTAEANSRYAYRAGGDTVYMTDLSSQTDGNTKTFTIPQYRRILFVIGSDFPTLLMQNNGFTAVQGTLTLTTTNAPGAGSQLGMLYVI